MSTPIDTFIGLFCMIPAAIKHMTTGEDSQEFFVEERGLFERYINKTEKSKTALVGFQTRMIISYINEQIRLTPTENQELYVNDLVLEFKKIEDTLFANWNSVGIWIIDDDTKSQNFELFNHCQEPMTLQQRYILNCLWLFTEFFNEFKKLCVKYKIDIGGVLTNFNFVLIDSPNYITKVDSNDETNTIIFNIELLQHLHRDFNGFIWKPIDFGNFKNCFRTTATKLVVNDGVSNAAFCYFIGKIEKKQLVVSNFSEWMKFHIGKSNFGKLKSEFVVMAGNIKDKMDGFSPTIPQQKAIEMKEEIDKRLKRIAII